jgi:hypothetical protein
MNRVVGGLLKGAASLGRCAFCMRRAFLAAAGSWCGTLAIYLLGVEVHWQWPALAVASAMTLLWLAHLFAHSAKAVTRETHARTEGDVPKRTRRALLRRFVSIFTVAAASTVSTAYAMSCSLDGNIGWGPCGTPCRFSNGKTMTCGQRQRPVYWKDGNCDCCDWSSC